MDDDGKDLGGFRFSIFFCTFSLLCSVKTLCFAFTTVSLSLSLLLERVSRVRERQISIQTLIPSPFPTSYSYTSYCYLSLPPFSLASYTSIRGRDPRRSVCEAQRREVSTFDIAPTLTCPSLSAHPRFSSSSMTTLLVWVLEGYSVKDVLSQSHKISI